MHRFLFLVFVLCFHFISQGQTTNDSLYQAWNDVKNSDTSRLQAMHKYVEQVHLYTQPDSAFYFSQLEFDFAESRGLKKYMASALNTQGITFFLKSNYVQAIHYYQRSLRLSKEIKDKKGIGKALMNIGVIYSEQNDAERALDYYKRSLAIYEELDEKLAMAVISGNIGLIYLNRDAFGDALFYSTKCLSISEAIDYASGTSFALGNIGEIHKNQGLYEQAYECFDRAIQITEENHDIRGKGQILNMYGDLEKRQGNYLSAKKRCQEALEITEQIGDISLQKAACECLYESSKELGNTGQALLYIEKMYILSDSLNKDETAAKLEQMEYLKKNIVDSLLRVEENRELEMKHEEELRRKNKSKNIFLGSGLALLVLVGGLYSRVQYIKKSKKLIEREKERSDNLLLNILPAEIAEELKAHGEAHPRDYNNASILFTDFREFTKLSEAMSAKDLVAEINLCFKEFDSICEKFGIEKIKTIGDSYMVAGGLPMPSDTSTKDTVLAAIEMANFVVRRAEERSANGEIPFEMRVGIHTGPVVAGIVGVKKFQYDIWGDTVNTASRMESNGEVGKVNISQATYNRLKGDPDFAFESRGKIEAKGKGAIQMWFVETTAK
jgi:class 3 adenylate cyclase/Tfp pilus assembly protein PilF